MILVRVDRKGIEGDSSIAGSDHRCGGIGQLSEERTRCTKVSIRWRTPNSLHPVSSFSLALSLALSVISLSAQFPCPPFPHTQPPPTTTTLDVLPACPG
ncbi:unnamed protein product [Mesocestoides corti]|uniref:Uncharacterized protein n=1 Tax=Mesocestoides corti TaxID=53468 RepID=A0A0R3UAS5_MESCO|nr:unnamed protein product [Mesocestoides corti]